MALRDRMAEFGFESNDDYEFQLRSLFAAQLPHLRCLNVSGESGRRKTAFAHALGQALEYPRMVYHDFGVPAPPPAPVFVTAEDKERPEPAEAPLTAFERAVVEACAFSEAERTLLILDQLQAADFRDQVRLYHFAQEREWSFGQASVRANVRNLLLLLISEQPLYHSLARISYRVWTDVSGGRFDYRPQDFDLGGDARELFAALGRLFEALGCVPTPTAMRRIVSDLAHRVRTPDQLRHALYAWIEGADRERLFAAGLEPPVREVTRALEAWLGLEEVVLRDPEPPPE